MLFDGNAAKQTAKRSNVARVFVQTPKQLPRSVHRLTRIGVHLQRLGPIRQRLACIVIEFSGRIRALRKTMIAHGTGFSI
jgi:hypothetical protein